jgi:hypothetical protein
MQYDQFRESRIPPKKRVAIEAWSVEIQGKRLTVKCKTARPPNMKGKRRGAITCFSRRARARRLRWIASVDWRSAGAGMLMTFTYPDEQSNHSMEERKIHRYQINRWVESRVQRQIPCFWRVEWMPRQTGLYVGQLRPHMHLLYLGCQTVRLKGIRERWQTIIGSNTYTQVDVTYVALGDMVSVYAAKYCSKEASSSYLDNVPYRNKTGRHTGELRRHLIPMHPVETVSRINQAILSTLQGEACRTLWWFDPRFDEGFTIIGDEAVRVIKVFHGLEVDELGEIQYDSCIE